MIRLALRVRREQAELVLAELLELAPAGVEEREPQPGVVEYAIYGAPGEIPVLPDLRAAAGEALVEISTSELPDDWSERWKSFHEPITIPSPAVGRVPALHVRPPWEDSHQDPSGHTSEIVIDPGQAFGTGAHATTHMCLELLLELASTSPVHTGLLDLGTGSGVLAIAAAKLGFTPVLALDNDPLSVTAAIENAAVNKATIEVERFDLRSQAWPSEKLCDTPLILANLLRPLLLDLARSITDQPAHLIASGLLRTEANEVMGAFAESLGLRQRRRLERGEWAALWLSAG